MTKSVKALQTLATNLVGDCKSPNVYFVTDQGIVTMVTTDRAAATQAWAQLMRRYPLVESALEDRQTGVISSVEPESDEPNAPLRVMA